MTDVTALEARVAELEAELQAVYASRSWQLTAPLRKYRPVVVRWSKWAVLSLVEWVHGNAFLRQQAEKVFARFPWVKCALRTVYHRARGMGTASDEAFSAEDYDMAAHALPARAEAMVERLKGSVTA